MDLVLRHKPVTSLLSTENNQKRAKFYLKLARQFPIRLLEKLDFQLQLQLLKVRQCKKSNYAPISSPYSFADNNSSI